MPSRASSSASAATLALALVAVAPLAASAARSEPVTIGQLVLEMDPQDAEIIFVKDKNDTSYFPVTVVELDVALCTSALRNGLPLADSTIYATAQSTGALLWTQDQHFEGLPGVRFFKKSTQ